MKRKHIPERTCLGCRVKKDKSKLLRFAFVEPDQVILDQRKKLPGRGAYLCEDEACLQHAMKKRALSRAYRTQIPPKGYESLRLAFNEAVKIES